MEEDTSETRTVTIKAVHEGGDVLFGGVEHPLHEIESGAADAVFDYVTSKLERFAYDWMDDGLVIGEGVWEYDGTSYKLQRIQIRDAVRHRFGRDNVVESEVNLPEIYSE